MLTKINCREYFCGSNVLFVALWGMYERSWNRKIKLQWICKFLVYFNRQICVWRAYKVKGFAIFNNDYQANAYPYLNAIIKHSGNIYLESALTILISCSLNMLLWWGKYVLGVSKWVSDRIIACFWLLDTLCKQKINHFCI